MKRQQRMRALWIVLMGMIVLSGVAIPLWVMADSGGVSLTATLYADVVRFEADGVASMRVTIYDLSENELWGSGQVMGNFVDWDRSNDYGERLANGYYLYLAQGWDVREQLVLNKAGKVVLLPGDQVQLRAAPTAVGPQPEEPGREPWISTHAYSYANLYVTSKLGVGTDSPAVGKQFTVSVASLAARPGFALEDRSTGDFFQFLFRDTVGDGSGQTEARFNIRNASLGAFFDFMRAVYPDAGTPRVSFPNGNVGIGTGNVTDKLTIEGDSGNLIACYSSGARGGALPDTAAVFRVEHDGDVYADGTVYAASTAVGSADVAERINVSEWVEAGDVVEIDPEHVGFFRKATGAYSRRVAGIISTSPGVILGNDIHDAGAEWKDNRPVLAIAGRVPIKVSTEGGAIAVGDLLVSSSVPGVAMKGDPAISIGAVVGKAMGSIESGEGTIMAQVVLR